MGPFFWNPLDNPLAYLKYRRGYFQISFNNGFRNYTRSVSQLIVLIDDSEP
jgi:hypothetical protein